MYAFIRTYAATKYSFFSPPVKTLVYKHWMMVPPLGREKERGRESAEMVEIDSHTIYERETESWLLKDECPSVLFVISLSVYSLPAV